MTLTVARPVFQDLAAAMGHESYEKVDLPKALSLFSNFLASVTPNQFDAPKLNGSPWRTLTAYAPTKDDLETAAKIPELDERSLFNDHVRVDVNCEAGLVAVYTETVSDGIWDIHVHDTVLVAKTDSWWDGLKRFVGYTADVESDTTYSHSPILYIPYRYRVEEVVPMSQFLAAQSLYQQICP